MPALIFSESDLQRIEQAQQPVKSVTEKGSPFKVLALDPSKVSVVNSSGRISLKAAEENELRIDATNAGDYSLYLYWSGSLVPSCPLLAIAKLDKTSDVDPMKVLVSGEGIKEARTKVESEFIIDGRQAGPGYPSCLLKGQKADVPVSLSQIDSYVWRASYVPYIPGLYKLEIKWLDKNVQGSPFRVQVIASGDASKVIVNFDAFQHGVVGQQLKTSVDIRKAGSGELMAQCAGPTKPALCDLIDNQDGTYTMTVKAVEVGNHVITTKFNGEHVPGSPHSVFISSPPDSSKVRVYGSGIEHGILSTFDSTFYVDTKGAGAGQLTIRVRGPKGAFNVEMTRENKKSRLITCRYEPKEPGDYHIDVKWAGEHVPDSPFTVMIFDTQTELDRFLSGQMMNPPYSYPFFPPGWIGPPPGVLVSPSPSNTIYSPMISSPSLPYGPAPQSPYFTSKSVH
ncbi:unnamed protein product [Soboliphyme baturini]|uniref:Filamin-A n=1 Tax=Soboliphyme baturini TaxID=241478 RepID=A0A183IZR5_9BILA|nr:unnamed protein product [Soboliphyme baturini]